jgi:hypothetical protein
VRHSAAYCFLQRNLELGPPITTSVFISTATEPVGQTNKAKLPLVLTSSSACRFVSVMSRVHCFENPLLECWQEKRVNIAEFYTHAPIWLRIRHCREALKKLGAFGDIHQNLRAVRRRIRRFEIASIQANLAHTRLYPRNGLRFAEFSVCDEGIPRGPPAVLLSRAIILCCQGVTKQGRGLLACIRSE